MLFQHECQLFQAEKADTSAVCPICWRRCAMFARLSGLKYEPAELQKFFRDLHHTVCQRCKRRRCVPFQKWIKHANGDRVSAGIVPCFAHPAKKMSKKKRLPEWWS